MPPKASRNRDRGTAVKFVVPFFGRPACPKCSQINVVRDYGSVPDCKKHVVNEHDMDFYLCCKYCNFSCEDMKKMNIHIRSCNARDKEEVKNYNNKGPIPKAAKLRRVPNIVTSQPRPESRTSSRSPPQQQNSSSAPRTYQRAPRPVSGSPVGQRTRSRSRSISATAPQQPSRQTSREPSAEIVAQTASPTPQNQQPSLQPIQEEEEVREVSNMTTSLSPSTLTHFDYDDIDEWVTTEASAVQQSNSLLNDADPIMSFERSQINSILDTDLYLSDSSSSSSSPSITTPSARTSDNEQINNVQPSPFANSFTQRIVSSVFDEEDAWVETEEPESINHQPINIDNALEDPLVEYDPTAQNFNTCSSTETFEKLHDNLIIQLQLLQEEIKESKKDQQKGKYDKRPSPVVLNPPEQTMNTDSRRSQSPRTEFMTRRSNKANYNKHSFKSTKNRRTWADYQRIQRLYRVNRKKAFNQIVQDAETKQCEIDEVLVVNHFKKVYAKSDRQPTPPPNVVPEYPTIDDDDKDPLGPAFTASEIQEALNKCSNSSPGPDTITYATLKKYNPSGAVLTAVFNAVKRLKHIPRAWNTSSTILIFKKDDPSDIKNWRPIALSNTISKLYASTLAKRIQRWAIRNKIISPSQKGFMPFEGCLEHTFEIQTVIQHAKRNRKEAVIAWLDLYNAFGNLPHSSLFQTLEMAGLAAETTDEIKLLYANSETSIRLASGPSESILIESGVKQGCPLSPILFNIAMEPLIRAIENAKCGYDIHNHQHSSKTFADDLCLIARGVPQARLQLNYSSSVANWLGIKFNSKKCSTLHIKSNKVIKTQLNIQSENMAIMEKETSYNYLGVPTGFKIFSSAIETIEQLKREVKAVDKSLLFPWQKFDAINTFITTKLCFHLKCGSVPKKPLNELDALIKKVGKKWLNLPISASCELLYLPYAAGGMNVIPTSILADISTVSHAFRLLTSNDRTTQKLAHDSMKEVVQKRLKKEPTMEEIAEFYNGAPSPNISEISSDVSSCWTKLRASMRRLSSKMKIIFQPIVNRKKFNLIINKAAATRFNVEAQLRDATRNHFKQTLLSKPSQGRVYNVTAKTPASNHFYRNGNFTRLTEWNFIHRARLDLVPLNGGTKRFFTKDQSCRKCKYPRENLQHVLNNCEPNLPAMTIRHDAIVGRLIEGFKQKKKKTQEILLDKIIPITASTLRPDITIIDEKKKEVILIDITCPYENLPAAFCKAREKKLEKYQPIKAELEDQGFNVFLDAFIIGSLGGYDPENYKCLAALAIQKRYAVLMKKLMVSDSIRHSREIYMNHVCQKRNNQQQSQLTQRQHRIL